MKQKVCEKFKTMLAAAAIAVVWLGTLSCGAKPDAPAPARVAIEPGTTNKFFTAVTANEIVPAEGARFELVTDANGKDLIKIIARDNHTEFVGCDCGPCQSRSGDPCKLERPPGLLGWLRATCSGSCFNSELGDCPNSCRMNWNPQGGDSGSGHGGGVMDPNVVNAPVLNNP